MGSTPHRIEGEQGGYRGSASLTLNCSAWAKAIRICEFPEEPHFRPHELINRPEATATKQTPHIAHLFEVHQQRQLFWVL